MFGSANLVDTSSSFRLALHIVAFGDENSDEEFDPNEPVAMRSSEMDLSSAGLILLVNFTVHRT